MSFELDRIFLESSERFLFVKTFRVSVNGLAKQYPQDCCI
jgi:hypothetical protein